MKNELGMLLALASIVADMETLVDRLQESLTEFKQNNYKDDTPIVRDMSLLMMKINNEGLSVSQVMKKAMTMDDIAQTAMELHKDKYPEDFEETIEKFKGKKDVKIEVTAVPMGKPGKA